LNRHIKGRAILFSRASDDRQEMRAIRDAGWQKDNELGIRGADDRHREELAPHLRRLRAESLSLNGQGLVRPVDRRTHDDDLLRL
jgi:hypothetical protein